MPGVFTGTATIYIFYIFYPYYVIFLLVRTELFYYSVFIFNIPTCNALAATIKMASKQKFVESQHNGNKASSSSYVATAVTRSTSFLDLRSDISVLDYGSCCKIWPK